MPHKKVASQTITVDQLEKTTIMRRYGIKDLKRYIEKLKKNIKVFEQAIEKERDEIKKTRDMIKILANDITVADQLKKKIK